MAGALAVRSRLTSPRRKVWVRALIETHKDDAIWELMYLGHARDQ
jgi:hypothetical protein